MTPKDPRAGDVVIAIDSEVAVAIAEAMSPGESPNTFLRGLFDMPDRDNLRASDKWRRTILDRYASQHVKG